MQFILEEFAIMMFLMFIIIFIFSGALLINLQKRILMNEYRNAKRETGVITKEGSLIGSFSVKLESEKILKVKTNKLYNE